MKKLNFKYDEYAEKLRKLFELEIICEKCDLINKDR